MIENSKVLMHNSERDIIQIKIRLNVLILFQIWHAKEGSNILATAPSNSAADLLAQRLVAQIPKTQILRYYAPTRSEKEIPESLRNISNLKHDCLDPSVVMKFR